MSVLALAVLTVAACLFLVEAAAPGIGVAGVAGAACLVLGVALVVGEAPGPTVGPAVAVPVTLAGAAALAWAGRQVVRTHREPSLTSGPGLLLGREATVRRVAGGTPQAFVAGAWWTLRSTGDELADGDRVWVVDIEDLVLVVERAAPPAPPEPEGNHP